MKAPTIGAAIASTVLVVVANNVFVVAAETSKHTRTRLLTGDSDIFDRIFASRKPEVLLDAESHGLVWTEGPLLLEDKLIFSDTVGNKMYSLDLGQSNELQVIRDNSGGLSPEDEQWRAEPGSNGLALVSNPEGEASTSNEVLVCQHANRRLSVLNLSTGTMESVASEFNGKRLNGPNDVVLHSEEVEDEDGTSETRSYAYFTDPVYAWLEKDRFEDLPYLDNRVKNDGPGYCGVYRVDITENSNDNAAKVELITSEMARPNGIAFDENDLIVSDCCQGAHLDGCTSGISRWLLFRQRAHVSHADASSWLHSVTIEDKVSPEQSTGGCADGFAIYRLDDESATYGRRRRRAKHVLIASCFGGLCIVDLEVGEVVARLWTANNEHGGCKVSNVAIGEGHVYLTGSCGILTLPLRRRGSRSGDDDDEGEAIIDPYAEL